MYHVVSKDLLVPNIVDRAVAEELARTMTTPDFETWVEDDEGREVYRPGLQEKYPASNSKVTSE